MSEQPVAPVEPAPEVVEPVVEPEVVEPAPEVVVPKPVVEQQLHGNADY